MSEQSTVQDLRGSESSLSSAMNQPALPPCLRGRNIEKIAKELGRDGKSLGRQLGFSEGDLTLFKMNNKDNLMEEIVDMFSDYFTTKARGDPLGEILAALSKIGRNDIYIRLQAAAEEDGDIN